MRRNILRGGCCELRPTSCRIRRYNRYRCRRGREHPSAGPTVSSLGLSWCKPSDQQPSCLYRTCTGSEGPGCKCTGEAATCSCRGHRRGGCWFQSGRNLCRPRWSLSWSHQRAAAESPSWCPRSRRWTVRWPAPDARKCPASSTARAKGPLFRQGNEFLSCKVEKLLERAKKVKKQN